MAALVLSAAILAAATAAAPQPSANSLSLGVTYCLICITTLTEHYEDNHRGVSVLGGRAQFERRLGAGVYVGATAAFETFERYHSVMSVVLPGATLGIRGGDKIRGGFRVSAGPAYAYDPRPDANFYAPVKNSRHSFGFFVDTSAEVAIRDRHGLELFLDVAILSYRKLGGWSYFSPIVPTMATLGIRFAL